MAATLLHGDCLDAMATIPDGSVNAIIADPPYALTQLKWDQPIDWPAWWAEAKRIAKPDAAFVLFAQQPFATDLINSNRKAFKYDLVWPKNTATGFLDANRRPMRSHELILVFGHKIRFNRVNRPRLKFNLPKGSTIPFGVGDSLIYGGQQREGRSSVYGDTECPKSILSGFPSKGNAAKQSAPDYHPTRKPLALMEWLVASYSGPGDVVLDSFMGSGTTGIACVNLGRQFVGIERDAGYYAIAEARIRAAESTPCLFAEPVPPMPSHATAPAPTLFD